MSDPHHAAALQFADRIVRDFDPQEVNDAMDILAPALTGRPNALAYYIAAVLIASAARTLDDAATMCAFDAVGVLVGFVRVHGSLSAAPGRLN